MSQIMEDVRNESAYKKAVGIASKLLAKDYSIEDIAECSGLSIETVKELAAKKKAQ